MHNDSWCAAFAAARSCAAFGGSGRGSGRKASSRISAVRGRLLLSRIGRTMREQTRVVLVLVVLGAVPAFLSTRAAEGAHIAPTVTATIPVGHNFGVAANPVTGRVYVASPVCGGSLEIIDGTPGSPTENTVVDSVPLGCGPQGVAVNPATERVYVTNNNDGTVSVIDGAPGVAENTVIATVRVGSQPVGIAADPATGRVYVANAFSNTVSVIDGTPGSATENTVIGSVPVGSHPFWVALNPITGRVYVPNTGTPFSGGTVSVIDGNPGSPTENTVVATVSLGAHTGFALGVNPSTGRVYVADRIICCDSFGNAVPDKTVSVIDGTPGSPTENTVVATVTVGEFPGTPAVNPNTGRVYVPNEGTTSGIKTVAVIDGTPGSPTENTIVNTVAVGEQPFGAAVNATIDRVYVGNRASQTVSVIADPANRNPICAAVSGGPDLWPPNHEFRLRTLTGATDPDGDPLTTAISGVTQDEPLDGLADGHTSPDARPGPAINHVYLRSERSGLGDGRVYRISFEVTDGRGGRCAGTATVGVPHDRHSTPIDSGGVFVDF